jgi:hypothetical protein
VKTADRRWALVAALGEEAAVTGVKKRKPCRATIQSDGGTERCEGFAGHREHFYVVARGMGRHEFRVSWPNRKRRPA